MRYTVMYRAGEFEAEVEAKHLGEAIEKFKNGNCEIKRGYAELWEEYIEIAQGEELKEREKADEG